MWFGFLASASVGYRPAAAGVARLRAPVARAEGARSRGQAGPRRHRRRTHGYLDNVAPVVGTHGYLDSGDLDSGAHGYLDNRMGLGRAGPFFAGASILFIACGLGSLTPGYLDWGGCVTFGELVGVGREVAVRLSRNASTGLAPEAVS